MDPMTAEALVMLLNTLMVNGLKIAAMMQQARATGKPIQASDIQALHNDYQSAHDAAAAIIAKAKSTA